MHKAVSQELKRLRAPVIDKLKQLFCPDGTWFKVAKRLAEISGLSDKTWNGVKSGKANLSDDPLAKLRQTVEAERKPTPDLAARLIEGILADLHVFQLLPEADAERVIQAYVPSNDSDDDELEEPGELPVEDNGVAELLVQTGAGYSALPIVPDLQYTATISTGGVSKVEVAPQASKAS